MFQVYAIPGRDLGNRPRFVLRIFITNTTPHAEFRTPHGKTPCRWQGRCREFSL
jgi:hypothetical protein